MRWHDRYMFMIKEGKDFQIPTYTSLYMEGGWVWKVCSPFPFTFLFFYTISQVCKRYCKCQVDSQLQQFGWSQQSRTQLKTNMMSFQYDFEEQINQTEPRREHLWLSTSARLSPRAIDPSSLQI